MPFTFSHPAIVLPLLKINPKWFSLTGLVIGAMAPDLEYFTTMKVGAKYSHIVEKVPFFELPLALIYCFVFHLLVRNILIDHLPDFFKSRFVIFKDFDWINYFKKHFLIVILSILIGTYSHLFWDAFTHEWGFFVQKFSVFKMNIISNPIEIPIYKFLQHFSTFVGGFYILFWIKNLEKYPIVKTKFPILFWTKIALITLILSVVRFIIKNDDIAIGNIIVTVIMNGFIALNLLQIQQKYIKS